MTSRNIELIGRWLSGLDWRAISQATIPMIIAGVLLKILGAV